LTITAQELKAFPATDTHTQFLLIVLCHTINSPSSLLAMLQNDPIVQKYPQYLPTQEEVSLALELVDLPEHKELKAALSDSISIAGDVTAQMYRFCWQARQDQQFGKECAEGAIVWLRRCVESRTKLQVDKLLYQGPFTARFAEDYASALKLSFHGVDRQGHPVFIQRLGLGNLEAFKKLWETGQEMQEQLGLAMNAVALFHIRAMEYVTQIVMKKESERQGRTVDRMLLIMDLAGVGMAHVNSPLKAFMSAVSKESTNLFPETLHATLVVNAPWIVAKAGWPIAKSFLHPVTQDKFTMVSSMSELQTLLAQRMALQDIPPYFGGKCSCEECQSGDLRGGSLYDFNRSVWRDQSSKSVEVSPLGSTTCSSAESGSFQVP